MADNFFRNLGSGIFGPVGDFVSGGVTALQPGRVQQMQRQQTQQDFNNELEMVKADPTPENMARLQQNPIFKEFMRRNIPKMETVRTSSKDVDRIRELQAIQKAAEGQYFGIEGGPTKRKDEETYKWAGEEIKRLRKGEVKAVEKAKMPLGQLADKASDFLAEPQEAPPKKPKSAEAGYITPISEGPTESFDLTGQRLPDYFQVATPLSSEENIPQTFGDIGLDSPQDMQTLQEMQKAAPDVDMREEYRREPKGMKEYMELWRQGKLNKANIHEAFAAIQLNAQQSLGIA